MIWRLVKIALSWLIRNGTFKLYSSPDPVGTRLGGHDVPELPDKYFVLDIRVKSRIMLLGFWQAS